MLGKKAGSVINLMFVFYYRVLGIGKTIFFICPLLRQALGRCASFWTNEIENN